MIFWYCALHAHVHMFLRLHAQLHILQMEFLPNFMIFFRFTSTWFTDMYVTKNCVFCWSADHLNTEIIYFFYQKPYTGCSDAKRDNVSSNYRIFELKITKLKGISMFIGNGHLTIDPWIWLKITSLSSTASVLKDGKTSLKIP